MSLTAILCMSRAFLPTQFIVPPTNVFGLSPSLKRVSDRRGWPTCVRYWPPWKRCWVDVRIVLARGVATAREPQRIVVTLFDGGPGPGPFHVDPQREHSRGHNIQRDIIP